ncbi:MAG: LEA type 2 family protein [Oleibacter sp.]|nr:LEA type 2 family protein [Thalassolituus sp.]
MKTSIITTIIGRFTALSLVLILSACASLQQMVDVKKPTANVSGVSLGELSQQAATLLIDLNVDNPNGFALDAAGLDLGLSIDGNNLANINKQDSGMKIPANGSGKLQLPLTLNFKDVLAAIGGLGSQNAVDYALAGSLTVNLPVMGKVSLPLNFADVLPIPQLPKVSFSNVSMDSIGYDGAKMTIDLDVSNPNIFGVNLNDLVYNLQANGKSLSSGKVNAVKLEKGQTQRVSIPLDVSLTNMGLSLFRVLSGGESVNMGLTGGANIAPDIGIWTPAPLSFSAERKLNK